MSFSCASSEEVTCWLRQIQQGDAGAFARLYHLYFPRLAALAEQWFRGRALRVVDGEDVAQSALHSFYRALGSGRFNDLDDRHNLWALLARMAIHKAANVARSQRARKRGGGAVRGESAFEDVGLDSLPTTEPAPDILAQMNETVNLLLDSLGGDLLEVARLRLEGYSQQEIAAQLDVCPDTVGRRLRYIRQIWQKKGEMA